MRLRGNLRGQVAHGRQVEFGIGSCGSAVKTEEHFVMPWEDPILPLLQIKKVAGNPENADCQMDVCQRVRGDDP